MSKTTFFALILCFAATASVAVAQAPDFYLPGHPGAPVRDYFQPTQIKGPGSTKIALAANGRFVERQAMPFAVGLRLGEDYRVRLTNLPGRPGKELFPTIKLIDRTFPPRGRELEFPIPIDISDDDIELALSGRFVTRVVYLEDPQNALPVVNNPDAPLSLDITGGADPLNVAATMGRPVAIIRLGGRVPDINGVDMTFFHGCPAWLAFEKTPEGVLMTRYENMPVPRPMPQLPPYYIGSQPQPRIY